MFFRSNVFYQYFQFFICVFIGWFMVGIWNGQFQYNKDMMISKQCSCQRFFCMPCKKPEDTRITEMRNNEVANSYYRSYRYTPLSATEDEIGRWRFLTEKYNYEMINQEPRVGLNGMWKLEVNRVKTQGEKFINDHDSKNKLVTGRLKLDGMHHHVDPFSGVKYLITFEEEKDDQKNSATVEMWRPYVPGKPQLVDIEYDSGSKMINIISPLSKVTERFRHFLARYEENILHNPMAGPVRILFVIFKPDEKSNDHTTTDMVTVIEKFKNKNPKALIDYTFAVGEFNRAVGLHTGVSQCDDNEIVLFLDVDLKVGPDFLGRIRRNTIQHRKVIFPIMYSQYDPDILIKAAAVDADLQFFTVNNMDINKQTGFWIYYAYGVAAMYKSDYVKVGGFRLDIRGWGGEDVDLFKKMVADTQLDVMSIVDPDLIHIYHKRGCDIELAPDQYDMCVGAWAETLGSQVEIASLYLDSHRKQHKGALL